MPPRHTQLQRRQHMLRLQHLLHAQLLLVQLLLTLLLLAPQHSSATSPPADDVLLTSGAVPNDTAGQPVSAHEGWLLQQEDSFLWYGTGPKHNATTRSSAAAAAAAGAHGGAPESTASSTTTWVSDSILLYSSHDLGSWRRRGVVFSADAIPPAALARLTGATGTLPAGPLRLERPKVLYNAARRYYVLVFHVDSLDRSQGTVGWAVSVSPFGPFKFDGLTQPSGLPSGDLTVAAADDGTAWLAQVVPWGGGVAISKLASDYLSTEGDACARIPAAAAAASPHQQQQRWWWWRLSSGQGGSSGERLQALAPVWHGVLRLLAGPLAGCLRVMQALQGAAAAAAGGGGLSSSSAVAGGAAWPWDHPRPGAAPCLFQAGGRWYLLAAQKPGWQPSPLQLYVNDGGSPCNATAWRALPSPLKQQQQLGRRSTFQGVPAFVWPYSFDDGQTLLLLWADRYAGAAAGGAANATYVYAPLLPVPGSSDGALQLVDVPAFRPRDFRPAPPPTRAAAVV